MKKAVKQGGVFVAGRDESTGQYLDNYGGRHYNEHDAFKADS
jgi:hypothetical protein